MNLSQGCKDSSIFANQLMWYTILTNWKIKSICYLNRCMESLWQNSTPIYDKNSPESRHRRRIVVAVVQSLSHVRLFVTPWIAACQASLSLTISRSLPKFMLIDLVMPSSRLIFWHPISPSAFNLSQHQGLLQWVICLHQMTKILEFRLQHQSFQWIFRIDLP